MSEPLFTITADLLETGLRGFPVGYCNTSHVDPKLGLFYRGIPLSECGLWECEEVLYLLYFGNRGSKDEVATFYRTLQERAPLSKELSKQIELLPRSAHPMKLFCMALLLAGSLEGKNDYHEDCLDLIAKVPQIAATVINHHSGRGKTECAPLEQGYMERFASMLHLPKGVDHQRLTRILKLFNVLHYDHGGGNLSTFVGKAIASGLEDLYGSMAGAMCALAGPRHGKANQDTLHFVEEIRAELGDRPSLQDVEAHLRAKLARGELVFGFGHAVLRVEDPRATILYRTAQDLFPEDPVVRLVLLLREAGPTVLKENPKIQNPYPNVDAVSGSVLSAAGFPYPDYYTVLFGLSRCVGIARQIVYERLEARGGKGLPIVRPKYLYKKS